MLDYTEGMGEASIVNFRKAQGTPLLAPPKPASLRGLLSSLKSRFRGAGWYPALAHGGEHHQRAETVIRGKHILRRERDTGTLALC